MKASPIRILLASCLVMTTWGMATADDDNSDYNEEEEVVADEDIRLEGVADMTTADTDPSEPCMPAYIKQEDFVLNGADWSAWPSDPKRTISVVHIGDSHLQADIATSEVRSAMQYAFGNAGRGLIEPLRLAGTNEPSNYIFRSNIRWGAEKFMKPSGTVPLQFTGSALYASNFDGYLETGTNDKTDWNPFSIVTLFIKGPVEITGVTDADGLPVSFECSPDPTESRITVRLARPLTMARIGVRSSGKAILAAAHLSADRPGIFYNVIGHNGATFQSYNRIEGFADGVARLQPELIIISLGTNEAFGSAFDSSRFTADLNRLIAGLRHASPESMVLLTTPQECDRRIRQRKRRRATRYAVNPNVERVRDAIMEYGRANGVAVYDYYTVAGGSGSAARWVADGLFSKDHIHLSAEGYRLQGRLLADALLRSLSDTVTIEDDLLPDTLTEQWTDSPNY